ncbi:RmlC-like cupin domain-containing protein [Lineolata rhizophorae]|uniref:RmlC-like cupin domain-containing protein n=1 Tax=Lineolata rhizophorae TaxID=578093 RepID=A0A6A6P028_9PEZI|nr:RmlC-like cupin domain-containing protein [Lineolata rhizophorae]
MPSYATVLLAALAAGAVQALPQSVDGLNLPTPSTRVPLSTGVSEFSSGPSASGDDAPPVPSVSLSPDEILELQTAPTAQDRFKALLTSDGENLLEGDDLRARTVFDFNADPNDGNGGGILKAANVGTFPILTDLGLSVVMGFVNPCGINTPHIHPRATEFLTVVDGELDFGIILENGLTDEIRGTLGKNQGAAFPVGSIHYQVNRKCFPSTFVAALNSEDPGTSQIANNFFNLDPNVVNATLGFPQQLDGKDIEAFRDSIPESLALGIENCLADCGLMKN